MSESGRAEAIKRLAFKVEHRPLVESFEARLPLHDTTGIICAMKESFPETYDRDQAHTEPPLSTVLNVTARLREEPSDSGSSADVSTTRELCGGPALGR